MIYAMSGVSGSGKTRRRETDPELSALPYVDMEDIYHGGKVSHADGIHVLLGQLTPILEASRNGVVVEAHFIKDSPSRTYLDAYAEAHGESVTYIETWLPKDECILNVRGKPGITDSD